MAEKRISREDVRASLARFAAKVGIEYNPEEAVDYNKPGQIYVTGVGDGLFQAVRVKEGKSGVYTEPLFPSIPPKKVKALIEAYNLGENLVDMIQARS